MVQHLGSEVTALLVVARVLPLLRRVRVLPRDVPLQTAVGPVPGALPGRLVVPYHLHLLVVERVFVFEGELGVLLDLVGHFLWFQADDVELAVLLIVYFSLVECQAAVAVAREVRMR